MRSSVCLALVLGDDVFLNEDGKGLRGHNANSLTHAMVRRCRLTL
jgi:hypothetical protein